MFNNLFNFTSSAVVQKAALLNYIINWGFWSLETETDYYASLDDGSPYISLTEKE